MLLSNDHKRYYTLAVILIVLIILSGYFIYNAERNAILNEKYDQLELITKLKISWLESWHHDEVYDANIISEDTFIQEYLSRWLITSDMDYFDRLAIHLNSILRQHDFNRLKIVDNSGKVVISATEDYEHLEDSLTDYLDLAINSNDVVYTDFHQSEHHDTYQIDYIKRIGDTDYFLVITIDPSNELMSMIELWPIPSRSAETALFRIDENGLQSISKLRFSDNVKIASEEYETFKDRPIVKVAQGIRGHFTGIDYKGAEVISWGERVPGTQWYLLSKIDKSEIYEDMADRIILIVLITLALIFTTITGLSLVYRKHQHALYRKLYEGELQLRKSQDDIADSLKEKNILLSEIHHRVKNNLAIVSSLLQLETDNIKNKTAKTALLNSVFRIQSMAMIHELLYTSKNFSRIRFEEYAGRLCKSIANAYDHSHLINIDIQIEPVEINIKQAIPIALIITEMVTNSYKHGFPNQKSGNIHLKVIHTSNELQLYIKDDGVGTDRDLDSIDSLGITLIKNLSAQLEGSYRFIQQNGFGLELTFPYES